MFLHFPRIILVPTRYATCVVPSWKLRTRYVFQNGLVPGDGVTVTGTYGRIDTVVEPSASDCISMESQVVRLGLVVRTSE